MTRAITFKLTCFGLAMVTGEDRYNPLFIWGFVCLSQLTLFLSRTLLFQAFVCLFFFGGGALFIR